MDRNNQETIEIGVFVVAERIGAVIGKAGAGLKSIREGTGCVIKVEPVPEGVTQRRAELSGATAEQVARALQMITSKVLEKGQEPEGSICVAVHAEKAGQVIGKGGENLKRVRAQTGMQITVERNPIISPSGTQERLVTFQGDLRRVEEAAMIIFGSSKGAPQHAPQHAPHPQPGAYVQVLQSFTSGGLHGAHLAPAPMIHGGSQKFGAPGQIQVRPPSENPEEIQLHVVVSDKVAGAVVGKDAANLKQTTAHSGCTHLSVTRRENSQSDRHVIMIGGLQQCAEAQRIVSAQIADVAREAGQPVGDFTVIFMVPKNAAGAVIGKEASVIKQIREQTGVKIHVDKEEIEGFRPCTLTGTLNSVLEAQNIVHHQVLHANSEEGKGSRGKRPAEDHHSALAVTSTVGATAPAKRMRPNGDAGRYAAPQVMDHELQHIPQQPRQHHQQNQHHEQLQEQPRGTCKLLVPNQSAGAVIGKAGCNLKGIRDTYGVVIDVLTQAQATHWLEDRVVILSGSLEARQGAVQAIAGLVFGDQEEVTLKLLVPAHTAGSIIGKGASGLKAVRESTGAALKVERDEIDGERLVTAQGSVECVVAGAFAVLQAVDHHTSSPKNQGQHGTVVGGPRPHPAGGRHSPGQA